MDTLVKGTKENLAVLVADRLKHLTSLSATTPTFSTRIENDDEYIEEDVTATVDSSNEMVALCLIDTTNDDYEEGTYELFLSINTTPEEPILGPYKFAIID